MAHDVFISHSSIDKAIADAVCSALEAEGIRCWIAPRDIQHGTDWSEAIVKAIKASQVMMLVFSANANRSPQVRREVQRAFEHGITVIPVRVEDILPHEALEYYISSVHWFNALPPPIEPYLAHLVEILQRLLPDTRKETEESQVASRSTETQEQAPPLSHAHNLPRQVTSFIGRERQRAEVKALLEETALLTLTAPGGSGKTRLALQVAAEVLAQHPDGVWLVELASLSDAAFVPQAVASVLDVREEPGRPLLQTLTDYLKPRTLLLVLDNCEHLLSASASLADTLLKSCQHLCILATSRERLGIGGERTYRVPPMSLPDPKHLPALETLTQYEAVRLFIERALFIQPGFTVNERNAPAVAQICHRLDGIPLAIELAAVRVKAMPVEQIMARLDDRFRLLTGGSRAALPRQQTLRSLIDWSYDLLSDAEKGLLGRLSVFAGGWTLEAAEAVCVGESVEEWEVLDLLTSLVDKSLIVYEEPQGQARYRLLETIRQYARDRLQERGEYESGQDRHQAFFVAFAEEAEPRLLGLEQSAWLDRLEREHDNLRAALDWGNTEQALRIAGSLWRFWEVRGYFSEGRNWLRGVLAGAHAQTNALARAKALRGAGALALSQGDYAAAQTLYQANMAFYQECGNKQGIAASLQGQGYIAQSQGNYAEARKMYEQGLTIARELEYEPGIASSLCNLGNVAYYQGDYTMARKMYEEGLEIARRLGEQRGIGWSLQYLGNVVYCQGDFAAARRLFEECLAIAHGLGEQRGIASSLEAFAALASVQEQSERAPILWGAAEGLREEIGSPRLPNEREAYDSKVNSLRETLGLEAFSAAWAKGRAMSLEQAVEYALHAEDEQA